MKVVVTGFEPFGKDVLNSSGEIVKSIHTYEEDNNILKTYILPVSFHKVGKKLKDIISYVKPDVLIMFGQSGSCKEICLEKVALNLMDAKNHDNDGYLPNEEKIESDGENAYFCNLPIKRLESILKENCIDCKISYSAGTYVCNCAYYNALYLVNKVKKNMHVIFVHVPLLYEQADTHKNKYYKTRYELISISNFLINLLKLYDNTNI